MNIEELLNYIKENVPNFTNPEIINEGLAYHYTMHSELIEEAGNFLGTSINEDIDRTQDGQNGVESKPGNEVNGVVFAYEDIDASKEECFVMPEDRIKNKIYELRFKTAIRANHQQEVDSTGASPTIIIIASDIIDFKIVYP